MVTLTREQADALDSIGRWLSSGSWMFYLSGFAGTGKTFLMHHFINSRDKAPLCLAPTGKAASVLQKKLQTATVSTIHSVLYRVVPPNVTELLVLEQALLKNPSDQRIITAIKEERERLAKKRLSFTNKENVAIAPGDLVIVDEASMVTNKMLVDLQATGAKVLFVGDAGQLPPVGDAGHFLKNKPDAMLTQVQRQALNNPIIRLSMEVREGKPLPAIIQDGPVTRIPKHMFPPERFKDFEQILTGTNRARRALNQHMRRMLGFRLPFPEPGDKLICLKNDRKDGRFFINGVQCSCIEAARWHEETGEWVIGLLYEGESLPALPLYAFPFEVYQKPDAVELPLPERDGLVELDFGYAITVHKAQGSEWNSVVIADDAMNANDANFRRRWLYTAITRAKEQLTWLTKT